jgi:hypothetical protein
MDILTTNNLKKLIDEYDKTCLSIYMPTFRKGPETNQNAIRFKNLLNLAESRLVDMKLRANEIDELLEEGRKLIDDNYFWQHQSDGLVFFRSPDLLQFYRLPMCMEELVVAAERFHVKPLMSLMRSEGMFYVLALNLNQIRLYECTKYQITEIELVNTPANLNEAMKFDDPEKQLQFHTGTSATAGDRKAMFHGQGKGVGVDDAEKKKNILRFFQQLDTGLKKMLTDNRAPLITAGVEYLVGLYKEANTYPALVDVAITHNPENLSDRKLHHNAWEIVQPFFQQAEIQATEKYKRLSGTGQTSNRIEDAVAAAHNKRIESLFIPRGVQIWGVFKKDKGDVEIHNQPESGVEDLLDLTAVQTLINGGNVYVVQPEEMPDQAGLAAVYRY